MEKKSKTSKKEDQFLEEEYRVFKEEIISTKDNQGNQVTEYTYLLDVGEGLASNLFHILIGVYGTLHFLKEKEKIRSDLGTMKALRTMSQKINFASLDQKIFFSFEKPELPTKNPRRSIYNITLKDENKNEGLSMNFGFRYDIVKSKNEQSTYVTSYLDMCPFTNDTFREVFCAKNSNKKKIQELRDNLFTFFESMLKCYGIITHGSIDKNELDRRFEIGYEAFEGMVKNDASDPIKIKGKQMLKKCIKIATNDLLQKLPQPKQSYDNSTTIVQSEFLDQVNPLPEKAQQYLIQQRKQNQVLQNEALQNEEEEVKQEIDPKTGKVSLNYGNNQKVPSPKTKDLQQKQWIINQKDWSKTISNIQKRKNTKEQENIAQIIEINKENSKNEKKTKPKRPQSVLNIRKLSFQADLKNAQEEAKERDEKNKNLDALKEFKGPGGSFIGGNEQGNQIVYSRYDRHRSYSTIKVEDGKVKVLSKENFIKTSGKEGGKGSLKEAHYEEKVGKYRGGKVQDFLQKEEEEGGKSSSRSSSMDSK